MNTLLRLTVAMAFAALCSRGLAETPASPSSPRRLPAIESLRLASSPLLLVQAEEAPAPHSVLPAPPVAADEPVMADYPPMYPAYRGLGFLGFCCEVPNPCAADLWRGFHPYVCEHPSLCDHLHGWLKSHHGCHRGCLHGCGKGCAAPACGESTCCPPKGCCLHKHLPKFDCFHKHLGKAPCCEPVPGDAVPMQKGKLFSDDLGVPMQKGKWPHDDFGHKPLWHHKLKGYGWHGPRFFGAPAYESMPVEGTPTPAAPATEDNELNPPPPPPVPSTARPQPRMNFSDLDLPILPGDKSA